MCLFGPSCEKTGLRGFAQSDQRHCYSLITYLDFWPKKVPVSSQSQSLRRLVWNLLCQKPRRQVFLRGGPFHIIDNELYKRTGWKFHYPKRISVCTYRISVFIRLNMVNFIVLTLFLDLLVWYKNLRIVHSTYLGVSGYNFQEIFSFVWRSVLLLQTVYSLMKCSIMLHFIWVFTVCTNSTRIGVFPITKG